MQTPPPKRNRWKRKFRANWARGEAVDAFAAIGGVLTITDDSEHGEHWTIWFAADWSIRNSVVRVDWQPSTGRVMINCRPGRTERRKTWRRLLEYVKERLAGKRYSTAELLREDEKSDSDGLL